MQCDPPRPQLPSSSLLIRAFFDQHLDALCSALQAAGAAEIAQLLRLCASEVLSHGPLPSSSSARGTTPGDVEPPPQTAFIRQRCWLELHHGVYRHVAVVWRDVYLATSLLLAAQAEAAPAPVVQQALKAIDGALLFGAILGRSIAEDVYEELSQRLHDDSTSARDGGKRRKTGAGGSAVPSSCVFDVTLAQEQLPLLTRPMPRLPPPSLLQFRAHYLQPLLPVVLESLADHWPATTRWRDLAYLEAAAGTRTVPVELGDHYLAHNWRQQLMPIAQFIEEHMAPAASSTGPSTSPSPRTEKAKGYVAQHDLFSQVKKLRADIVVPDYVCTTCHSDAAAGVCPAAASALLSNISADSPYHLYHCCSASSELHHPCPSSLVPRDLQDDDGRHAPLSTSPPPRTSIAAKVPRECVSPTPPHADGSGDGDECSVRMHAWFGPAGLAARRSTRPWLQPAPDACRRHRVAASS